VPKPVHRRPSALQRPTTRVQLDCTNESGERTAPTTEPCSVRHTSAGHLLLFGVRADTGESRSYRLDRIWAAAVTGQVFQPQCVIQSAASGPIAAPTLVEVEGLRPGMPPFRMARIRTTSSKPDRFVIHCCLNRLALCRTLQPEDRRSCVRARQPRACRLSVRRTARTQR